jgi:hypothetical protein
LLRRAGYSLDRAGSTPSARKFKRGRGEVVVVVREGRGWFDPLRGGREERGDVLSLAAREWARRFAVAVEEVALMVGAVEPSAAPWRRASTSARLSPLRPGSPAWRYLTERRTLPRGALLAVARRDLVREGVPGAACARHVDALGAPVG